MSTFSPNLNLEEPALGADVNSWNVPLNSNFTIIDDAIAGVTSVALTNANVVLTNVQSAYKIIVFAGTLTASVTVQLAGNITGQWTFANTTTGAFSVTVMGSSGDTGIVVPQGGQFDLICVENASSVYVMVYTGVATVAGRQGAVTLGVADVSGAAPLASPAFTGAPTAPTQTPGDNTTKIATDAFVTAAIAAQVAQTPQRTVYTTASGTYTKPTGATYLEVEAIGGGSGGGGSGISTGTAGGASGAGGNTTFGSGLTAGGGPAAPASGSSTIPTPATATGGDLNISGGLGQFPSEISSQNSVGVAGAGAASPYGAGGSAGGSYDSSGTITAIAAQTPTAPGAGGGAGGAGNASGINGGLNTGWNGNAGAFLRKLIASPAATYAYAVGAAGTAGTAGTDGQAGAPGAAGLIIVTAYFQ